MAFSFVCEQCGEGFTRQRRTEHGRPHRFCSKTCWGRFQYTGGFHFKCEWCGEDFTRPQRLHSSGTPFRFCSKVCRGLAERVDWLSFRCEQCGEEFVRPQRFNSEGNPHRFCSTACMGLAKRGEANPAWKGGNCSNTGGYLFMSVNGNTVLRHRVVAVEALGRELLPGEAVHHIDRNRQNNEPKNLMLFPGASAHAKYHMGTGPEGIRLG